MSDAIPILFTAGPSRHDVLLISPSKASLDGVKKDILSLLEKSPNCEEFMAKYKKGEEEITRLVVKWNAQSHDPKIYPATTIVTEDNIEALVKMIGMSGVGKDTLEVQFGKVETKEEPKK